MVGWVDRLRNDWSELVGKWMSWMDEWADGWVG